MPQARNRGKARLGWPQRQISLPSPLVDGATPIRAAPFNTTITGASTIELS